MKKVANSLAAVWLLLVVAGALGASFLTGYDPNTGNILDSQLGPSLHHWLGTDQQGRDVLTRLLYGARTTLIVAVIGTIIATALAVASSIIAGYYGGKLDKLITAAWDIIISLPSLVLALVLVTVFGRGLTTVAIVLSIVFIPIIGRVLRPQVLVVCGQSYMESARLSGVGDGRMMFRHVLLNLWPIILVRGTLALGYMILDLSALSYLGIGVQPPRADWGAILAQGRHTMLTAPWPAYCSGFTIAFTVLAIHLLSDALQSRLNPRVPG